MENKTLPNFKPVRSLIIQRYVVVFTNTIGEAEKNFGYAVHDLANVG